MRVLFLYPSLDCPPGLSHGVAALSGVLKAHGHETHLIHVSEALAPPLDEDGVAEVVRALDPALIAHSVMSQQYAWSRRIAEHLRERFPIPQVIGGVHCTMVPDDVVRDAHYEFVCVGEGEAALLELVERLERGDPCEDVPNLRIPGRFSSTGKDVVNAVGPFPDLAALPPKDYELFDLDRLTRVKDGWFGMLTSRGCPYKCTYCFNKEIVDLYLEEGGAARAKDYLRHYPVPRVLGEIAMLKARLPDLATLIFDDDLFTLNRGYVEAFTRAYREAKIELPFVVNAHVQQFDDSMAAHLASAGCTIVKFGLESGSPRVRREVLWRYMTNDTIARAFDAARTAGLHSSAFVMFGLPSETREEVLETIRLCARVQMGRFRWAIFFPFPGTAGHKIARDLDLIDDDRMGRLGNYFDGSCLRLGDAMDLFVEKLSRVFHWYVNAESPGEAGARYAELVREVEAWDRAEFEERKASLARRDRELSEELLLAGISHYSLRYSHVMAVHSDYVLAERERALDHASAAYTLD